VAVVRRWGDGLTSAKTGWGLGAVTLAFVGLAILRFDMIASVRYFPAKVVVVQDLPQMGLHSRAVLVDLGDQQRVIRTHDRYVRTFVGAKICVSERRYLFRSIVRFTLEMSVYCPGLQTRTPAGDGRPALSPSD
jgi:hypothetical protein